MTDQRMPYGVAIHDSIKRGNVQEMQQLLVQARAVYQQQGGDLGQAIQELEAAIQGGVGQTMPYGVAIYDAIRRNDRAAMQTLLDQARDTNDPSIAAAVKELEAALKG